MSLPYLLVRLRSVIPFQPGRRVYTMLKRPGLPGVAKFEEQGGWYKVPTAVAEVLRNEMDTSGEAVFDVVTQTEALALEQSEKERAAKKILRATAAEPRTLMNFSSSKSAASFVEPEPVAPPTPRAPIKQAAPKAPAVVGPIVATEDVDWDSIGGATSAGEFTEDTDDAEMTLETVSLSAVESAPVEPAEHVEPEAPRVSRKGRKGK